MSQNEIGLIGIGLLGSALAERLLNASFAVVGYDIAESCREELQTMGGRVEADPGAVAAGCRRVVLSLPNTDIVETVISQMESALQLGQTIVDTTTGDPGRVAALGARLAERGVDYLDATISGSSAEAKEGRVIVMAGGSRPAFDACEDIFRTCAKRWFHVGEWGSGARMKLASNLVLGLNRAALAEGLAFARSIGLDLQTTLSILIESAAYSRVMDTKGEKMNAGDFSPQARLSQHLKDVRLILAEGESAGARLPFSELHRTLLEALEQSGFGDADNSAIIRAFETPGDPDAQ